MGVLFVVDGVKEEKKEKERRRRRGKVKSSYTLRAIKDKRFVVAKKEQKSKKKKDSSNYSIFRTIFCSYFSLSIRMR